MAKIDKDFLIGFVEVASSFYLIEQENNRIVHGFKIISKLDLNLLEAIRTELHIKTKITYSSLQNCYMIDTTNSRAIENLIKYFHNAFIGMKSVEYKI